MSHEEVGYRFDFSREHGLLRITFTGQWTLETVDRYRVARVEAFRSAAAAGVPGSDLLLLVDRVSQPVQTQAVVDELGKVVADNQLLARKTAVVVTSALHARQIRRTGTSDSLRVFADEAEARAWLQAGD